MAYDAEKFDLGSSRDHAPTTCAAPRDPIARAAPVDPKTLTTPRERLEYLRDFLRGLDPAQFDMSNWSQPNPVTHECLTPACIGGWAAAMFAPLGKSYEWSVVADLIGVSEDNIWPLFFPGEQAVMGDGSSIYRSATPRDAASVLDHLMATGKVDWSVARSEA